MRGDGIAPYHDHAYERYARPHLADGPREDVGSEHEPASEKGRRAKFCRSEQRSRLISRDKMVGVARIELATPAMSTPATHANLRFFGVFGWSYNLICPIKPRYCNRSGSH